jgi:5'-nucleotidase
MKRSALNFLLLVLTCASLRVASFASAAPPRPATIDVQVLAISDFNGNLEPPTGSSGLIGTVPAGGAAFLATHVAALRAENPERTLLVSSGDVGGASPALSAIFHDEPAIEVMNLLGLDYNAAGENEFGDGIPELRRLRRGGCHPVDGCLEGAEFRGADFKYLAANVVRGRRERSLFPRFAVERVGAGVKVALIGVTTEETPNRVVASGIAGWTFRDEADTVNALVPKLRRRGIEAIVVLVHEGGSRLTSAGVDECGSLSGPIVDIVEQLDPAVDLVIAGRSHQAHVCVIDGIAVTGASSFGKVVTDIDLTIDTATRDVTNVAIENIVVTRDVAPDPDVAALVDRYRTAAAPILNRVIGRITGDVVRIASSAGEQAMGDALADAQLAATWASGAQIAVVNPGGVRADLRFSDSAAGEGDGVVTYGEAFAVQPFSFPLVISTLTGSQLDLLLEQQFCGANAGLNRVLLPSANLHFAYRSSGRGQPCDVANAVDSITLDGVPIDPAASYRVTANEFLASGGDGFPVLADGTDRVVGPIDLDALVSYLGSTILLSPPVLDRITTVP